MDSDVLILGCGFTGRRVAQRLLARGARVTVTTRDPEKLDALTASGAKVVCLDGNDPDAVRRLRKLATPGCRVLDSIPALEQRRDVALVEALGNSPARVVYFSTTGVYGDILEVDEFTVPAPRNPRKQERLDTERVVQAGSWSALVLRSAALYGPGRGIHVSIRSPSFRLPGDGSNYISRIHVDDLAAHAEAALLSNLTGAYPVADELPCTSHDIAEFCARLLGIPMPETAPFSEVPETRRCNRRVDGSAIRRLLGVTLRYPSYREGIPASVARAAAHR